MYTLNDTADYRVPQLWEDAVSSPTRDWNWNDDCLMSDSQLHLHCVCKKCMDEGCLWCCPKLEKCCLCYHCTECWTRDWSLVTATQISIFILFLLGIVSVIIMYFRICRRSARHTEYSRQPVLQNERNDDCAGTEPPQRPTEFARDRPPSYNEACSAPPLYNSPYNRVSMLDPPPVYPDTPKSPERMPHSNDPTITQHI